MNRIYLTPVFFLILTIQANAQQYGLFNTKTLFDAFENPAQKAFILDSSRQFASNFFLPNFGVNAANKGDANNTIRGLISNGLYTAQGLPLGSGKTNTVYENANIYLFAFRIFKSYKFNKEIGFAWQVRTDAHLDYTNESLALLDDYNRFDKGRLYENIFNDKGQVQTYHQFSISYRENYNKKLSFGAKLSLLSGITYNKLDINGSSMYVDPSSNQLLLKLTGAYKSSFFDWDEVNKKTLFPNFKSPGLSLSLGTTYNSKKGVTIMANLKDLGFIKWSKKSHTVELTEKTIEQFQNDPSIEIGTDIYETIKNNDQQKSFYSLTNAKADFLISKAFDFYVPGLILSKNLVYKGGDLAFINTFKYRDFSASIVPNYNLNGFFMIGAQGMYKTPNFEFFLGSDNLSKTAVILKDVTGSNGYNGASFYMGMSIKFGYVVNHPLNSSYMPGIDDQQEESFFKRIFSVFSRKR
ncbi:DUF5723 family protein [Pedobacter sp. MC2016-14]|uniref:DUF5723 family protein n=1 Tax=Pedobacter sp. MC2016-14 TaxID=2897327 RepID=UPI001E5FCF42|nr:DUF5723 family protein [Pedobacter sp. MC2016-14]MCD0489587.1 DUF5723 family protein [Pedobacter sp. MC2016-14]